MEKLFITWYEIERGADIERAEFTSEGGLVILVIAQAGSEQSPQNRCAALGQAAHELLWPYTLMQSRETPKGITRYEQPPGKPIDIVEFTSDTGLRVRITAPRQQPVESIEPRCKALAVEAAHLLARYAQE